MFPQTRRHCPIGVLPYSTAQVSLDVRTRCSAVRGEMVAPRCHWGAANFARNCLTATQFSSVPSGFWSSRRVEDPWTPAICGTNRIFSTEGEASKMDLATAISFGSLAEVTNMGIETCAAGFRTVDGPRKYSPGENARMALTSRG